MTVLSVNLNKIALLRNSRETTIPSVVDAARVVIGAGAQGITVHPRPDMRHIRPDDARDLARLLAADFPAIEFNIEGNPFAGREVDAGGAVYPGFLELVRETRPAQCTLVPDDPTQLTSDHGWDLDQNLDRLRPVIDELHSLGIRTSLFMDPDHDQIRLARDLGTDRIELYTGPYADTYGSAEADEVFARFHAAAGTASNLGIGLNAGHDLNLLNLARFCSVPDLLEVSIGHAIICDALSMGLATAVAEYRRILDQP